MRIAYFTAGSLGAGHQVRGLALARALQRQRVNCELRLFLPVAPFPALEPLLAPYQPQICPVSAEQLLDRKGAESSLLRQALQQYAPDVLIVDLFWAPLVHILPVLDCEAWLIVRSCPASWFDGTPRAQFDAAAYQRVIAIEPLENPVVRESVNPIVVCNPDEAKTREDFCARWSLSPDAHIAVITHAGLPDEIDELQSTLQAQGRPASAAAMSIVRSDMHSADAIVPLAPWLPAVDQVFSAAGYNSYWEARWMGYAHKTTLMAIPRRIDNPQQRIGLAADFKMTANGADELARSLAG